MEKILKISAALDLAEEYYEYGSPEWRAFNKGFGFSQDYWMNKHYACKCKEPWCEAGFDYCETCHSHVHPDRIDGIIAKENGAQAD